MDLKFVEAGNGPNWGKFAVGRFTAAEWAEPTAYPGTEGGRLIAGRGWTSRHVWVLDLQTGEGAMFLPSGPAARADLARRQIRVCPLYEPFLEWLYRYAPQRPEAWWSELPRVVELPAVPAAIRGYRRTGHHGDAAPQSTWAAPTEMSM